MVTDVEKEGRGVYRQDFGVGIVLLLKNGEGMAFWRMLGTVTAVSHAGLSLILRITLSGMCHLFYGSGNGHETVKSVSESTVSDLKDCFFIPQCLPNI